MTWPTMPTEVIPRTIHLVWVGSPVPAWVRRRWDLWRRWADPRGIEVETWDEGKVLPWTAAKQFPHPVVKADFLRVEIVAKFGGMYVDSDTVPLPGGEADDLFGERRPWSVLLNNPVNPREVNNGVFGFPAWHPFLQEVWEAGVERLGRTYKRHSSILGPVVWTSLAYRHDVELMHYERFYAEDMDLTRHTLEELSWMHPGRLMVHEFEQSWQHGYDGHGIHKPMPRWERRMTTSEER